MGPKWPLLTLVLLAAGCAAAQQTDRAGQPASGEKLCPAGPGVAYPAGSLPNAPSAVSRYPVSPWTVIGNNPYVPIAGRQKFDHWLRYTYSPYTFTSALFNAAWAQMVGDWPTYGGGAQGYGKRIGATLADTETSGFFKAFLLPVALHDDPRFFYSGKDGVVARGWYAATRVLVTRKDDGESVFNTPEIAGALFSSAVTNAYYPRADRGFSNTFSRAFGGVLSDASSNVLREFWPDISRIFKKHEPCKIKNIEKKLPKGIGKVTGGSQ